jgi:EmrB/QacA subfamily drug resistance transporter
MNYTKPADPLSSAAGSSNSPTPVFIVILMTAFITTFTGSALNLSVPAISSEFNTGAVNIGWIVTGYLLASAALSVPFGRFADLYGRRSVFVTGEIIFTACCLLCAVAQNTAMIITFRIIQGIGSAMIFATNIATLITLYPPEKRGTILGISTASTYLGLSLGPVVGGVLNNYLGWRSVFFATAVYGCIMTILAIFVFKPAKPERENNDIKNDMDLPGCGLYTVSLFLIMYGFSSIMSNNISKISLIAGIVLLIIFIRHEFQAASPVVDMTLFTGSRVFGLSNLAALLNYGASFAISYLLSIYLQSVQGFSSQAAGLVLITSPVIQTILSPVTGRLSDRIQPYILASLGMSLTAVGIFMFIFTTETMSVIYIMAALAVIGIGFAFFSSPNTNAVMGCVDKSVYSVASSILATSRSIGHTVSMAIVSSVVAVTVGNITIASASTADIISAMRISFIIFTLLCIAGVFCSASRREVNILGE